MSLDLHLARHGETVWHAENRYAGVTDVELTATGRRQAADLAAWAGGAGLDAVWTSTRRRARETAAPAAAAAGVALVTDARLGELDFGVAEGRTVADLADRYPDALAAFRSDPVAGRFPEGEDPSAAVARFTAAVGELAAAHPDGRVLLVAHSTVLRLVLCTWLGIPLAGYRAVLPQLVNAALTRVRLDDPVALLSLNVPTGDRS